MQPKSPKSPKHIQSIYTTQQRKLQSPNPLISTAKLTIAKFSRQSNSRLLQNKKSLKSSRHIPDLNLDSANSPRESVNAKEENAYEMKHQHKGETKHANLLTSCRSYRDSEYEVIATGRQLKLSTSDQYIYSPMQTLKMSSRSKVGSDSFNTEVDNQEVLVMEVKQLKRENTFLKKKIKDLQKEINGGVLPEEYQQPASMINNPLHREKKGNITTSNIESLHLSVNLFFQQIRNLLTTVTHLFRIPISEQESKNFRESSQSQSHDEKQPQIPQLNLQTCPLRRHQILKKHYLNKKLQRLACQDDCHQYGMLLSIFAEYYTFKEESERKVVETVDSMVMYMNDLSKWLVDRAAGRRLKSDVRKDDDKERVNSPPPKFDPVVRVPPTMSNYVMNVRGTTLSPLTKIK